MNKEEIDSWPAVSFCGLSCNGCPIFWATREPDADKKAKMRTSIAGICNVQYGFNYTAVDISDCTGCRTHTGQLFSGCLKCQIRICALFREVETCAHCPDYACEKLLEHQKTDPSGKIWLEIIHDTLIT